MDSSAMPSWLSETVVENQNQIFTDDQLGFMDTFDEELAAILGDDCFETCLSPGTISPSSSTLINVPSTNSISSFSTSPPPPNPENYPTFSTIHAPENRAPVILNFGNADQNTNPIRSLNTDEEAAVSKILKTQTSFADAEELSKHSQNKKRTSRVRPASQTYDHIIAERKRREQLSQRFVALSTIVPGLKKTDKTSILGDAINYLKYLQERVKTLEEHATNKTMESVMLVKKSKITMDDDDKNESFEEQSLPEIEARICNNQILIRIHSENQKGLLANLIGEVEKLNLSIFSTNVVAFGKLVIEITIITEMEKDFKLSVNDVVKRLHAAIITTSCV